MQIGTRRFLLWCVRLFRPPASRLGVCGFRWRLKCGLLLLVLLPWVGFQRLCLALDFVLFPGFRQIQPKKPLFIVGVPRSATTFLQRLIALDRQQFTSLPLWESVLAPALSQKYFLAGVAQIDRWLGRPLVRIARRIENYFAGDLQRIHATSLWLPEEDYLSLIPIAACLILIQPFPFEDVWRLARIDRELKAAEKERLASFYRGIIQRHLYFRGPQKRLLSKNPSFTGAVELIRETFPDCCIVATAREPRGTVGSLVNCMYEGALWFGGRRDDPRLRDHLIAMLKDYYQIILRFRDELPPDRWQTLKFEDLTGDPLAEVLNLYDCFDYEVSDDFGGRLIRACAMAKGFRSRDRLQLQDFGLDTADVDREFESIRSEFGWSE